MRFCAVRNIGGQPCHSLHFGNSQMGLPKPECTEWKDEHTCPLQAVPCPAWQESAERYVSGAASNPERLTRRTLANLPNQADGVKLRQRRRGYHAPSDQFARHH